MARILLVDDEPNVLITIEAFLQEAGHEVHCTKDPVKAKQLLEQETFDVAVTDNIPPVLGVDIVNAIQEIQPDTPVVLISGQNAGEIETRAKKVGAFGWLQKPMGKNDICKIVEEAKDHRFLQIQERFINEEANRIDRADQTDAKDRLLTDQLVQTQKLESIGVLASGVAHEINNPLNGIMNYAELICLDASQEDRTYNLAKRIIDESKRVASLVGNILDISRRKEEKARPVSIEKVITSVLPLTKSLLREAQITLLLDISNRDSIVVCNQQQIQQVLINLITNARDTLNIKYPNYNKGKIIEIKTFLTYDKGGEWVCVVITDQGTGISKNYMKKIFEPFFTTKTKGKGTGLGLSICRQIVNQHGGFLKLESVENKYTQFKILLPALRKPGDLSKTKPADH